MPGGGDPMCNATFASPNSSVVPVQPAAVDLLTSAAPVLTRWGRWFVFGAQAVAAYGVPRLSADVDVTILLVPDDPERFALEMRDEGFSLRVDDPDFVRRTRVMPFLHVATAMPVDVVLGASGLEVEFAERAVATDIGGIDVPVIELSDLIVAKVLAGRPKDIEDVRSLWRVHRDRVDESRIRATLRLLEDALSQSDLLPVFEPIVRTPPEH